jgi:hypothetical protein
MRVLNKIADVFMTKKLIQEEYKIARLFLSQMSGNVTQEKPKRFNSKLKIGK